MNDPLEERLRQHLSSADDLSVRGTDAVRSAAVAVGRRRARRRQIAAGSLALALVAGAAVLVLTRHPTSPSSVVPVTTQPGTTQPGTTQAGTTQPGTTEPPGTVHPIAPDPRGAVWSPAAVWTGHEVLAVGGVELGGAPVGGAVAYDPSTDTWRRLADPLDGARANDALTVWAGDTLLMIGGDNPDGTLLVSAGQAYDVATDTWRHIAPPPTGFVSDRSPFAWTGHELLVWPWDGGGTTMAITPIAYDPTTDAWHSLAQAPVARRQSAASVWTGTEWIVWGGTSGNAELADGAAYSPATDTWRVVAPSTLSARRAKGVWTGTEMIVDAGSSGGDPVTGNGELALADGAAYNPVTDAWRTIAQGPAHPGFVPIWTGSHMVMFAKGGAVVYDVAGDRWLDHCCTTGTPVTGTPVWTGSSIIVVGSGVADSGGSTISPP